MQILSWNVNGIRAIIKKGIFPEWLAQISPDILCIQEAKANKDQVTEAILSPYGYNSYWNSATRPGYSGVVTYTKQAPVNVIYGLGNERFDNEGRVLICEFPSFSLFNIYYPNGGMSKERLEYKLEFYNEFLRFAEEYKQNNKRLIICGDFNTAHNEIDLARPKQNEKVSGFLPVEREWMDKFISHGYIDTFRHCNNNKIQYSWWDYKTRARDRNIGWRIDYFFITENLIDSIENAFIMEEVSGSDHCPVGINLSI